MIKFSVRFDIAFYVLITMPYCNATSYPISQLAPLACIHSNGFHTIAWAGSGEGWEPGVTGTKDNCGKGYYEYDSDNVVSNNTAWWYDDTNEQHLMRRMSDKGDQGCKTYKNRRYYISSVADFVNAYGKWEGSGVTGDCNEVTVTTQSGETLKVYAQIGCSMTNPENHDRLYLNYFTDSACAQGATGSWWDATNDGTTKTTIQSKEVSSIEKYTAIGVNWWSNDKCYVCLRNTYDICADLLCQSSVTECVKGTTCYNRIMEAIGNDTREATLLKARLVGFLAAFVGLLWVTKTFVARRKKDNDVVKNDDSVTEDEMEMSEYSTSDDEMSYHRIT
ncbi:hypothetical protein TrCOL_g4420 [Triparma columacea]|uniref:Uncharacterized protein n=1 Tax=Triparma columacea TaxID=722753 RepID=A0A9W7L7P0_9STRA|nr:hypothetical protein TrCOL_g4420 [Triparma columacea]